MSYKEDLKEIERRFDSEKQALIDRYTKEFCDYSIGDIVKSKGHSIKVDSIRVSTVYYNFCILYEGYILDNQGNKNKHNFRGLITHEQVL